MNDEIELLIDENGDKVYMLKKVHSRLDLLEENIKHLGLNLNQLNDKSYYKNKLIHREDGPSIENANGSKEYYKNGIKISEEKFYLEKELKDTLINKKDNKKKMKV